MKSELIVDVQPGDVTIALLEDSRLVSLQKEARNVAYAVGDIYLAKVKKLMPGLNAAFVNVGYEKDAFLHYLDLGPNFAMYSSVVEQVLDDKKKMPHIDKMTRLPEIDKHGSVTDVLAPGRQLLVQYCKRAYLVQRSATDHGDLVYRPQHGADAVWRKGVGVAENRFDSRKDAPAQTGREHQA